MCSSDLLKLAERWQLVPIKERMAQRVEARAQTRRVRPWVAQAAELPLLRCERNAHERKELVRGVLVSTAGGSALAARQLEPASCRGAAATQRASIFPTARCDGRARILSSPVDGVATCRLVSPPGSTHISHTRMRSFSNSFTVPTSEVGLLGSSERLPSSLRWPPILLPTPTSSAPGTCLTSLAIAALGAGWDR